MKTTNRKTIFALLAVILFAYFFWQAIIFTQSSQNNVKNTKEEKFKKDLSSCVVTASKSGRMTKKQADDYCNCILTYLNNKYSEKQLLAVDSILKLEMDKAKECLENSRE